MSFFENLADILTELGHLVPQFNKLAELVGDHGQASCRVKVAIKGFDTELFALYRAVALVFTKKSGSQFMLDV